MLPPRYIMTPSLAKQQEEEERDAQKKLIKAQQNLDEKKKELNKEERILAELKGVFVKQQTSLEDEISRLDKLASEEFKSNGVAHFGVQPCGKCSGRHTTSNCHLFNLQRMQMQTQQKAFEERQGEIDAQKKSLDEQQGLLNERHKSMKDRLSKPRTSHAHVDGGAKTKRRHSKSKRSRSKSKRSKSRSHRR
jgi:hypothetical protein